MVAINAEKLTLTVTERRKGKGIADLYVNGQYAGMMMAAESSAQFRNVWLCQPFRSGTVVAQGVVGSIQELREFIGHAARAGLLLEPGEEIDATSGVYPPLVAPPVADDDEQLVPVPADEPAR